MNTLKAYHFVKHYLNFPLFCVLRLSINKSDSISRDEFVVLKVHLINIWLSLCIENILLDQFI
jgi:hypothetical protein